MMVMVIVMVIRMILFWVQMTHWKAVWKAFLFFSFLFISYGFSFMSGAEDIFWVYKRDWFFWSRSRLEWEKIWFWVMLGYHDYMELLLVVMNGFINCVDALIDGNVICWKDGEFESDEDSDEKAVEPGRLADTVENGLQPLPLAEPNTDNVGLPVEDETDESSNAPPAPPAKKRKQKQPKLIWEILKDKDTKWVTGYRDIATILEHLEDRIIETAEPSRDLTMPLRKYQKEWLAWALKQEASETRGGILADEMGMGKTIQAIALVLAKPEQSQATSQFTISSLLGQSLTGLREVKGTLIICPPFTLTQWENEIKRSTETGSVKVLVYHRDRRGTSLDQLADYDFILTTYGLVEKEYDEKLCTCCHRSHGELMNPFHMENFCPQNPSIHSEEVSPVSKSSRKHSKSLKGASDIGQTSSMRKCASSRSKSKGELNLHFVKWQRIILDEVISGKLDHFHHICCICFLVWWHRSCRIAYINISYNTLDVEFYKSCYWLIASLVPGLSFYVKHHLSGTQCQCVTKSFMFKVLSYFFVGIWSASDRLCDTNTDI